MDFLQRLQENLLWISSASNVVRSSRVSKITSSPPKLPCSSIVTSSTQASQVSVVTLASLQIFVDLAHQLKILPDQP